MSEIITAILAISSWATPQPALSAGLVVIYGNQRLVEANAEWRGYDLGHVPGRCGLSAISPAHLGRLAYVSLDGEHWQGPCLVVDAVSRLHAYESIYDRHEVAEVSRATAAALGFDNGGRQGYIWFGACPPAAHLEAQPYAPVLAWDAPPYDHTPSYYPYPPQQAVRECAAERPLGWMEPQ